MKIKQLHYFMSIAEYLNYKYASEAIDVSPSLLSQQIVGLEEELGVELFERNNKNVKLTQAGEELKKRIPEIEDLIGETMRVAAKMREDSIGTESLHLGYEHIFDKSIISGHLLSLKKDFPHIHCMMRQHTPEELSIAIQKQEIDCAFMILPTDVLDGKMTVRTIEKDRLVLVVHKELLEKYGGDDPGEIMRSCILYGFLYNSFGTETVVSISRSLGIRPKLKICAGLDEMLSYVESGLGCTILPESFVFQNEKDENVAAIPLLHPSASICMSLVYNGENVSGALKTLLDSFIFTEPDCLSCDHIFCTCWNNSKV